MFINETSGWECSRRRRHAEVGRDGDSELLMSDVISEMLVGAVSPKTRPIRRSAALRGLHEAAILRPRGILRWAQSYTATPSNFTRFLFFLRM